MLATFCLRLACGLIGSLLLLPRGQLHPKFYRTHFLIVLGLISAAMLAARSSAGLEMWVTLSAGMILAFLGSIVWSLEGAPGGRLLVILTTLVLGISLVSSTIRDEMAGDYRTLPASSGQEQDRQTSPVSLSWLLLDQFTSAALLGTATTAMLVGHSYLIAPTMSLAPLMRLLHALVAALGARSLVAAVALWFWTNQHFLGNLKDETVLWLLVRWGIGFAGPLILAWMARESAKIRSTQSATGILYVVVIFCFLGELTSQLLLRKTGSLV